MSRVVFEFRKVCRERAGKMVLSDFYLLLRAGEIVNLIGLEGSGHEELYSLLLHAEPVASGSLFFDGHQVKSAVNLPLERHSGLFYIGNEDLLIPDLSVAENLYIIEKMSYFHLSVPQIKMIRQAKELFDRFGIEVEPGRKAGSLGKFESAMVRFMRAYIKRAKVIIVNDLIDDYPQERIEQLRGILKIFQEEGIAILWLNHYPDEISRMADRGEVIRDGKNAFGFRKEQFDPERILRTMIGETQLPSESVRKKAGTETLFSAVSLTGGVLRDVSFSCSRGEVLGLYDIQNRFNRGLCDILTGKQTYTGTCCVCGKKLAAGDIQTLTGSGIALINGQDYQNMIFRNLSLEENISMISWKKAARGIFLTKRVQRYLSSVSSSLAKRHQIRRSMQSVNRQEAVRIIFNRFRLGKPHVYFCFQPFLRLDAVSRNFLSEFFFEVCEKGCGVVLGSANLADLETVCDRILEIGNNRIVQIREKGTDY